MIGHQQIKKAVATAIADSEEIAAYCVEHFGRAPLVIVDWYGQQVSPSEEQAPFIFLYSANENESGFVDEETFDTHIVCAAVADEVKREIVRERTDTQSGLVINGIAEEVEGLRMLVEDCLRNGEFGATPRRFTREESSTLDLPLEWAKLNVEFFEPQTL